MRLVVLFVLLFSGSEIFAQTGLEWEPGLVYLETTESSGSITTTGRDFPTGNFRRALISFRPDSAEYFLARYDSLELHFKDIQGDHNPETTIFLGKDFKMRFDENGFVKISEVPDFSDDLKGLPGLSNQFDDFFIVIPKDSLVIGSRWSWSDSEAPGEGKESRKDHSYEVIRDTTILGMTLLVIEGETLSNSTVENLDAPEGSPTKMVFNSNEMSTILYSSELDLLVSRIRRGNADSEIEFDFSGVIQKMTDKSSYESSIQLVKILK